MPARSYRWVAPVVFWVSTPRRTVVNPFEAMLNALWQLILLLLGVPRL